MHKATKTKLKLGQINFINCLPINYPISKLNLDDYEFTDASPAELNKALRERLIDIAPISSYEYLSNKDSYDLIPGISISSRIEADSVLLFVRGDLKQVEKIHITDKSATSINLLKVLLSKTYSLNLSAVEFISFDQDSEDYQVKLLIGDEALKADKKAYDKVLDLGKEWHELTELPMVFGLWAANKGFSQKELKNLSSFLAEMRDKGLNEDFPDIIVEAFRRTGLAKSTLTRYFDNLDYNFTEQHQKSLELFETYLRQGKLL